LNNFCSLNFLPVKISDDPKAKSDDYPKLSSEIKDLMFKCIVTIGKLIEWARNAILAETRKL
jgi:hypothetical protein